MHYIYIRKSRRSFQVRFDVKYTVTRGAIHQRARSLASERAAASDQICIGRARGRANGKQQEKLSLLLLLLPLTPTVSFECIYGEDPGGIQSQCKRRGIERTSYVMYDGMINFSLVTRMLPRVCMLSVCESFGFFSAPCFSRVKYES